MPETIKALKRQEKVMALSRFARQSAELSALKANLQVGTFEKDASGVPLPSNGIFWSVSHKPECVAGIVSRQKVGIDIEKIKDVSEALFKRIVTPEEAVCFSNQDKKTIFFRAFTAKEAVLKITTLGMKGLSKVRIKTVGDEKKLMVQCLDQNYWVENFSFDGYLASVTKGAFDVQWTVG